MIKGRSSSEAINKELRRSIAIFVGQNVRPFFGYVRSKSNPADDPTRQQAVRKPVREEAGWWKKIGEEDYEELDEFLKEHGVHPEQVSGLPDVSELLPDLELDGRTNGEIRADRGRLRRAACNRSLRREEVAEAAEDEATEAERAEAAEASSAAAALASVAAELDCGGGRGEESLASERIDRSKACNPGAKRDRGAARAGDSAKTEGGDCRGRDAEGEAAEQDADWTETAQKLKKFKRSQFVIGSQYESLEEALRAGPGVLDLYSGKRGFSKAISKIGSPWCLCFDLKHGIDEDLLESSLQDTLRSLLSSGAFLAMAASPVCASFSTAITPPWRTRLHRRGIPGLTEEQRRKVDLGHRQLEFTIELVKLCIMFGILFWIENPDGSWFWRMDGELSWTDVDSEPTVGDFRVDQCVYGTPWRKRTRFKTNCHLRNQKQLCKCKGPHVQLRGRSKQHGVNYTKLAESYPRKLCSVLAGAMAIDCGFVAGRRQISASDCVFADHKRIGEAKNPGPRVSRRERTGQIDDIELLEPQTVRMRAKLWTAFEVWLDGNVGTGALEELLEAPAVLVKALEGYGKAQFSGGAPLHYYRQLLAHVQKEVPLCRPYMQGAWTIVSKWELAEPTQHRPPIPEPVVTAISALALMWRWPRFACSVLLCYYGIMRIGEVLGAKRRDLLTPKDLMSEDQVLYFKISYPKSRGRGPRVQYTTFTKSEYLPLLLRHWEDLGKDEPLYPLSASAFRRRWDSLLQQIGVEKFHNLTPGSLRGGGCVWAHRSGLGIQELLWKMRLQHMKTLGYYLQEVTAVSILPNLKSECRSNIAALQGVMPLLTEAVLSAQATQ